MSTLRELRETLDERAGTVDDTERYARPVAVRARIRAARRRRAGLAASTAAAVALGSVAAVGTLRDDASVQPAGPAVLGLDVPQEVTLDGRELAFARALDLDDGRLRLPASGRERAVSLVTDGLGDGSATLLVDGIPVARAFSDEPVEAAVPAYAAANIDLRVRLDGTPADARVGVAVYEDTGRLADGVTDGTRVFRDSVAGSRLVAADFSEPGAGSLELPFDADHVSVEQAGFCTTSAPDVWATTMVDGRDLTTTSCDDDPSVDVGSARTPLEDLRGRHTLGIRLTRGHDGPPVAPEDAVLGLAVYTGPGLSPGRVAGFTPPAYLEAQGRTWKYVGADGMNRDDGAFPALWTADDSDALVAFVTEGDATVSARWRGRLSRGGSDLVDGLEGHPFFATAGLLLEGDEYEVTLASDDGAPFRGGVVWYEPVPPDDPRVG